MNFFDQLAGRTTVTVESALFPTLTFNVGDELAAPQGALTKLLKPKITVRTGGQTIVSSAPAGDPAGSNLAPVAIAAALVVAGVVAWAVLR